MKALNVITKAVGITGLGLIAYDSHMAGKIESSKHSKEVRANNLSERYMDDMKLDSPSTVKMHVKKGIFKYFVDENISGFFTSIGGYAKGFGSMMVGNVIPLALAVGSLVGIKRGSTGAIGGIKGGISKFCGAGLLAYGGIFLAQEVFGIGKSH